MIKKLRIKFIAVNMSIAVLMLCVIMGMVIHFTRSNLENESLHMMRAMAERPFQPENPGMPRRDEIRLPYFILHLNARGDLLAVNGMYYELSDKDFIQEVADEALTAEKDFGVISRYHLRFYRRNTPRDIFLVFADMSSETATLHHLIQSCAGITVLSLLLFFGVSIILSGWAVRPVERAWKQQRQFVADASHELKTPLTVIMTNAEMAEETGRGDPEQQRFLGSILTMSRQMKGLIEQMLELARADNAAEKPILTEVPLSRLVSETVLPFEALFFEGGHELTVELEEGICVKGDAGGLRQVTEILLDNAQKYACSGGTVRVSLQKKGKNHCILTVANEGPPIPEEQLQNIFKRFYRADEARSRNGSYGLGLSIAESIVTRHKGKIHAESRDGINAFRVQLPCV